MNPEAVIVSVVIPSYNSQEHIESSLEALSKQDTGFAYDIVVVDCSDTQDVSKICSKYPKVKLLRESERFLPGEGRNIGARASNAELLVFLDADVVLDPSAIEAAVRFYQAGNKVFGGSLELNEPKASGIAPYVEHYFFNHEAHINRPPSNRSNLSSALMVVDRKLFIEHKGFKDIPRMQDTEFTERLAKSGESLKFTPTLIGLQHHDSPMSQVMRKIYINGKNLYYIRYQNNPKPKQFLIALLLPAIACFKVLRIIGRHMKYQSMPQRVKTLKISPFLFAGAACWMVGFYNAIFTQRGIGAARE